MKLFLDIDGVLIDKYGNLADGAVSFLQWAINNHEPYWISTRTRDGTHRGALIGFHGKIDETIIKAIQPVRWRTLKTEAVPIENLDWVWIDDELLHAERAVLEGSGALDRFIQVKIDQNPSALSVLPNLPIFRP